VSCLHLALSGGHWALAEELLRRGADAEPPPPSLPYKVDTTCPSLRTDWTRLVPLQGVGWATPHGSPLASALHSLLLYAPRPRASGAAAAALGAISLLPGGRAPLGLRAEADRSPPPPSPY
jgi:hypothetical protein